MLTPRTTIVRRVLAALDASPSRIPVLLGGCGSGRTTLLQQLRDRIGRTSAQYVDVEHSATTPERFLSAVRGQSPFPSTDSDPNGARAAFDAALTFLNRARVSGSETASFLIDEFLELRTFESFPGLRRVLHEFLDSLAASGNRFVLTSRYTARALRLLRDRSARFEVIHLPSLSAEDIVDLLGPPAPSVPADAHDPEYLARTIHALTDGRPSYVRALTDEISSARDHGAPGGSDAISALAALIGADGRIARQCNFSYELRLHRARGYGALKAILDILAEEEGLTLTEISQRLHRTPGSTKDYLSWLEDVDLVISRQKRYSFADPLLRVWVRLHCRVSPPTEDDLAREIHRYALPRLPQVEPAGDATPAPELVMAVAGVGAPASRSAVAASGSPANAVSGGSAGSTVNDDEKKPWGIIEID
ncbi:MAG TPA: winged helix-turn-helix transcriptional regulator [Vicinamibacterales bacterium]|nr:winged helix-turn-helix transcriptional regulator [Vicinamibacterales bacterium]